MTRSLYVPLIGYAACGLVLSLAAHLVSLAGFQPPGGNTLFFILTIGLFPLGLAAILISKVLFATTDPTDLERHNRWFPYFAGCPAWMNFMVRGFLIYFLVIFAISTLMNILSAGPPVLSMSYSSGAGDPSVAAWRGFSSGWMGAYSILLALFTTTFREK
jgi:hypothetical protein